MFSRLKRDNYGIEMLRQGQLAGPARDFHGIFIMAHDLETLVVPATGSWEFSELTGLGRLAHRLTRD